MKNKKLGIIVPYRNRYLQLIEFKSSIVRYFSTLDIPYELIIVEQDDAKDFNRGKLLNIGFKKAQKLKCDYVVFHDVDMEPIDVDYSYSEYPTHLATTFQHNENFKRTIFDSYFGGVTLFPTNIFEKINGYSNDYWGWGYEDDDLLFRCDVNNVMLDRKRVPMMNGNTAALKFNGINAYVEFDNVIDTSLDQTIFVSFYPEDIKCDHENYDDTYSIFSVPGFELRISYNSYSKYNFVIYDVDGDIIYFNSDIKTNYKTNICVTINNSDNIVKMYQDGLLVGEKSILKPLYRYQRSKKMYLGTSDPETGENNFSGLINTFVIYTKILEEKEIIEISNNKFFGLSQNFGDYVSADSLKVLYDAKFIKEYKLINLVNLHNDGQIHNCEIVGYGFDDYKEVKIPYRRECLFALYPHEENGFVNGSWKEMNIRYNQMRFHNEVLTGSKNIKEDGLSNLSYKILSEINIENQTHLSVSI